MLTKDKKRAHPTLCEALVSGFDSICLSSAVEQCCRAAKRLYTLAIFSSHLRSLHPAVVADQRSKSRNEVCSAKLDKDSSCVRSYASPPRHQSRRRWSWGQNHSESSSSYLRQDWCKNIVYGQVVNGGDMWHYVTHSMSHRKEEHKGTLAVVRYLPGIVCQCLWYIIYIIY